MDEKVTVYAWVPVNGQYYSLKFYYKRVWGGKSIIQALYHAWIAKAYSGCVKIEWRGTR